ncbi:hypothetical protein GC207_02150 [bacterium]|nr:hypothetical protein [bacterium]
MKTSLFKRTRNRASALMVVMVVMPILIGLVVAGLICARQGNLISMRAQAWNAAIPVAEAGIEDALTHLNVHGLTNLNCDGWQLLNGTTAYYSKRTIGDHVYLTIISNFVAGLPANTPIIESRGYTHIGGSKGANLARGVRVTTVLKLPMRGLVTRGQVEIQDTKIDSFDSSDPNHSTNGMYNPATALPNSFVGTNSRNRGDLHIHQTAQITGSVATGASGVFAIESPARAGDAAFVASSANNGKIQAGTLSTGLNVPFPNVPAPSTAGAFFAAPGTFGGTNYNYLLGSNTYTTGSLNLVSNTFMVTGNATLYVGGSFSMNGGSIVIAPGAKLDLYVRGGTISLTGDAQLNATGTASQFALWGLSGVQQFTMGNTANLVGTIYTPQAHANINGSSVITGAAMFAILELQGHTAFHYDEALAKNQNLNFIVTSWNEMDASEVATVPTGITAPVL